MEFEFTWGPENHVLDTHEVIMKRDFHQTLHVIQGIYENILMLVFLKREQTPYLFPLQ